MKFCTSLFMILVSTAILASTPKLKPTQIEGIFVPEGFDSNDRSEIFITGFLPNLCHKSPEASVKITNKKIDIKVESLVYTESDPFCAPIVVPFMETVELGFLDRGKYEITVNGKTPFSKKSFIKVNESTSEAVDDFIYAQVEYVEKNEGSREIVLRGSNPSDCFELESVDFISNGINAYSVLPKLKRTSDFCPLKLVPFAYKANVPSDLPEGKILLHVRVMEGKSINTLYLNQH